MGLIYRAIVVTVSVLAIQSFIGAQYRPLERHRFENGGYTLVGIYEHHDNHIIQRRIGEFYTDDPAVLNAIKKSWNFSRPQRMYACGYHYYVVLLRNGEPVDDFSINLDCEQIVTAKGSRFFKSSLLTDYSRQLGRLTVQVDEFTSVDGARKEWARIKKQADFVHAERPEWLEYEGSFRFQTRCPDDTKDCYRSGHDTKIVTTVREKIAKSFPGEKFELKTSGGSSTGEVFFEIKCDQSLEQKFVIYDRWGREGFGKWQPFPLALRSYWKGGPVGSPQ